MVVGFLNVTELEVCVGKLSAHVPPRDRICEGVGMGMHTVCDHGARINLTGSKQVQQCWNRVCRHQRHTDCRAPRPQPLNV